MRGLKKSIIKKIFFYVDNAVYNSVDFFRLNKRLSVFDLFFIKIKLFFI